MSKDWKAYVDSAKRQCEVSAYFAERLADTLGDIERPAEVPPIPVQAYFEGVIVSCMAAVDKIAQAANSALDLRLGQDRLVREAFAKVGPLVPEVKDWFDETLGVDLRRIRARIVHYAYLKSPDAGRPRWRIESADTSYEGSRELLAYAAAAAKHAMRLRDLLDKIEHSLAAAADRSRKQAKPGR